MHAKVVVADDITIVGTINLDAWALYRNSEIMMIARSPRDRRAARGAALRAGHRPLEARASRRPGTRERFQSWLWDKLSSFL